MPTKGRPSPIDKHPEREQIIAQIMARIPRPQIAEKFGLKTYVINSYVKNRLLPMIRAQAGLDNRVKTDTLVATEPQSVAKLTQSALDGSTLSYVERKLSRYDRILQQAESGGDVRAWAQVDRAETATLELRSRLKGETQTTTAAPQVVVLFAEGAHQRLDLSAGKVIDPET